MPQTDRDKLREYQRIYQARYRKTHPWIPKIKISCGFCGKEFLRKKVKAIFCSYKCSAEFRTKDRHIFKNCLICDFKMKVPMCLKDKRKFCSRICSSKYQSVFRIKENSPSWRGGIKKDRDKRKSYDCVMWRKQVFERDNYTCQMCGQRGGILQADHIKPFALYSELRFELSNGRTLCVACHRSTPTYGAKSKALFFPRS